MCSGALDHLLEGAVGIWGYLHYLRSCSQETPDFRGAKKVGRLVDNELITKAECHLALSEWSASRLDFSLQGESLAQVRLLSWALTEEQDLEWQE